MLHVSLLGEQTITDGGTGAVRLRSSRTVALLGFLAAHAGSPQTRQRIAGLFWPDSTDAQALTNLRRELHTLRQVLGDEPSLVVTARDLCWRDTETCSVDLRTFDIDRKAALVAAESGDSDGILAHAAQAVTQYQGDFLPGMYDDWLLDLRSVVERQAADLCDLICTTQEETGNLAGAVDAARRRIQLQPLEEAGYRTLMRLQADLGDRAGALSTYHHCASVLERELGVVPDAATRDTLQRLMAHADSAVATLPAAQSPAGRPGAASAALVGRSRELRVLQDVWQAAAAGRPSLLLVQGGAGVGKSRLVAEVADLARRQRAIVASTQCFATSGRLALAPVADWLRNPAVRSGAATLEPAWRAEVERLVPSGQGRGEPVAGSRAMVDAWQRHRFFEGLARALIGTGRPNDTNRPILLILDNLQWCDQETLAFLAFCLGLDPSAPILITGTLRNDNPDECPELDEWIIGMRASGLLTELSLDPLEASETAYLAETIAGRHLPEADRDLLHATTGGFPLYIVEAVRSSDGLSAGLPVGDLTAVLRNRLGQVSAAAREVAGLAASVGRDFTLDLLSEASDLEADAVVGAVDELWRRRIMREFRDGYDFSHDLLRETAYAQVSPPRRWLLHRRVAQGLELLYGDDTDPVAAQLAEQYARAGRPERAVAYYRRAADLAAGLFAHGEAIRLHQKALSVIRGLPESRDRDRQELAILEGIAAPLNARYGYSSPELQQTLERTIVLAESLGRKDSTLAGLVALWTSQFVQGRTADSYQTATRAMTLAEPGSELSGPAHFAVGGSAVSLGMPAEAVRHLELAADLASGAPSLSIGTRPDVHSTAWVAHARWLLGQADEAQSSCVEAIRLGRQIEHPYSLAVALAYGSITHQMRHDQAELIDAVGELREMCDRYRFAYYREWGLILDGWSRADASGIDLARQGIGNLRALGAFARMPYWLTLLAELQAGAGQADAARATLDAALVTGQANDDVWWLPEVIRMRAACDADDHQAISRLRAAAALASAHGSVALLRRCERDIAARGVRLPVAGVLPTA
ncbi:MAG TPA: AAA family ATPase [Streptosporangiaceae bacterium]|nr:AAA family ATPase [Streptosporangiaceae bacterium]